MLHILETPKASDLNANELVQLTNQMISGYQSRRTTMLALSITDHIELLGAKIEQGEDGTGMCDYQRLAKVWRYIARST